MTNIQHPLVSSWAPFLHRRDVLRVGSLALAGSVLPGAYARAALPEKGDRPVKSVILLWMSGGVTHIDSFDPKPEAPQEIRGPLASIATTVPGIRLNETLPRLAQCAQHLAIVRTFCHDSNDHFIGQAHCLSSRPVTLQQAFSEPNIGAVCYKLLGPRAGLPGYVAVPGTTRAGPEHPLTAGWLGAEYNPLCTGGMRPLAGADDSVNVQGLQFPIDVTAQRLGGRRSLRQQLDASLRQREQTRGIDVLAQQYGAAYDLLLSPKVRQAFDVSAEAQPVRERYGRTKIGQRCLLARRLVEAGARFVLVDYGVDADYGNTWDNHNAPGQNHPPIHEIVKEPYHLAGTDRAFAGLLEDLHQRGLLEETLVVFLTEFGRTPKINKDGGRDHWCYAGSLFFAGGGTRGGQVIGATDKQGGYPITASYGPGDVAATIYEAMGLDSRGTLQDRQHRPLPMVPRGAPIPGVL